jgi:hypothetical protein
MDLFRWDRSGGDRKDQAMNRNWNRCAMVLVVGLAGSAMAQAPGKAPSNAPNFSNPAAGGSEPKVPAAAPATPAPTDSAQALGIAFGDEFFKLEEVGLRMRLPLGAAASKDRMGQESASLIVPEDQKWAVRVRTHLTNNAELTLAQVCDSALQDMQKAVGVRFIPKDELSNPDKNPKWAGTHVGWTERLPNAQSPSLKIRSGDRDIDLERFYVALPRGNNEMPFLRGWTVMQVAPQQFVSFDMTCEAVNFDDARRVYEAMIATVELGNPEEVTASRGAAVDAGLEFVRGLSADDFAAVLGGKDGKEKWIRMYKPSPTGARSDDEEIGYTRIASRLGQRGQIDPTRSRARWTQADRQDGYILEIDARFLAAGQVVDSKAVYFMSPDRNEEAWTVRNAFRVLNADGSTEPVAPRGKADEPRRARGTPSQATEVGARKGNSMQITVGATGQGDQIIKPVLQSDAYISRVEGLLMPQFLARRKMPIEYGFYAWHGPDSTIRLRRDIVSRPEDHPDTWKITTRFGDDERTQVALYTDDGELIRTAMPDGVLCLPATAQEIMDLWKSKGLPTGKID